MRAFLYCLVLILTSTSVYSQVNGDWYSFRTVGFTRLVISDSLIVNSSKVDSINGSLKSWAVDTLSILKRVDRGNATYIVVQEGPVARITVQKFVFDPHCSCLYTAFADWDSLPPGSIEETLLFIQEDTSRIPLLRFYSTQILQQFAQRKLLRDATRDEVIGILDSLDAEYERYQNVIETKGVPPIGAIALLRGNIEYGAIIANGISPFVGKDDWNEVLKKYGDDPEIQRRLSSQAVESQD